MEFAEAKFNNSTTIPAAFNGLRVLLVDNDTETLLNTALILESCSYKVTTTELAPVALSILQERKDRFDLIMADFNMPEMDSLKFIEGVKLIRDLPILFMSSGLNKDEVREAMAKGACFFIRKPISSGKLRSVWQHVYKRRRHGNTKDEQETETPSEKMDEYKGVDIVKAERNEDTGGFKDQIENSFDNVIDGKERTKLPEICMNKSLSTENDISELKRNRAGISSIDF